MLTSLKHMNKISHSSFAQSQSLVSFLQTFTNTGSVERLEMRWQCPGKPAAAPSDGAAPGINLGRDWSADNCLARRRHSLEWK
ncbi:hypothetical protein Drorol1_Dr00019935 [Drosera rotundifolia]